jgi:hypothetical protein
VEGASEALLPSDVTVDEVSANEEELLGFWGSFATFMEYMWKESGGVGESGHHGTVRYSVRDQQWQGREADGCT